MSHRLRSKRERLAHMGAIRAAIEGARRQIRMRVQWRTGIWPRADQGRRAARRGLMGGSGMRHGVAPPSVGAHAARAEGGIGRGAGTWRTFACTALRLIVRRWKRWMRAMRAVRPRARPA